MLFKKERGKLTIQIPPRTFAIIAFFVLALVGAVDSRLGPLLQAAGSLLHLVH